MFFGEAGAGNEMVLTIHVEVAYGESIHGPFLVPEKEGRA